MLVFSTPLVYCCPSTFSLTPPPPKVNVKYIHTEIVWLWGGWGLGGVEMCCRTYSAQV
jgi:hypothetical protein